jgi:protein-tyrosine kinase
MSVPAETLGAIATAREEARLVAVAAPASGAAAPVRLLRARRARAAVGRPLRAIAITSCARGEGRSTTAANLALTAAREGRETALVEGDLRRPGLARLLDVEPRAGLAEIAEGRAELAQALVRAEGVALLCAGAAHDPAAAMRSPRLAAALDALRASFPLVLVDAPTALFLSDGSRLAASMDGIILVVRAGETPRDLVRMAIDALPERLLGIVLNGVDEPGYARRLNAEAA